MPVSGGTQHVRNSLGLAPTWPCTGSSNKPQLLGLWGGPDSGVCWGQCDLDTLNWTFWAPEGPDASIPGILLALPPTCKAQSGETCRQVGSPGQDLPGKCWMVFWVHLCFRDCREAGHTACPHPAYSLAIKTENSTRTRKGLKFGSQICTRRPGGTDPVVVRAWVYTLALPLSCFGIVGKSLTHPVPQVFHLKNEIMIV